MAPKKAVKATPDPPKTTGSASKAAATPDPVAGKKKTERVQSPSSNDDVTTRNHAVSDTNILSYSEDISEAEAPLPLPAGDYPAEIKGAEVKTSAKGTQYVSVQFYIAPEHYPADYPLENAPDGTTLSYNRLSYEDSTRGRYRMRRFCEAVGAATSKNVDVNDFVGLTAVVTVGNETFEGEERANIAKVSTSDD